MTHQSEAQKIVEAALRGLLGLHGDIGEWLDLRLHDVLPDPTTVEKFWICLLEQMRFRQRSSRAIRELSEEKRESLLQETGHYFVDFIAETLDLDPVEARVPQVPPVPVEADQRPRRAAAAELDDAPTRAIHEREAIERERARLEEDSRTRSAAELDDAPTRVVHEREAIERERARLEEEDSRRSADVAWRSRELHEPPRDYVPPPPLPPPPPRPDNASLIRVYYVTDRLKIHNWSDGPQYNFERSQSGELQYGECTISIPKIHKMGKLESPSLLMLEFRPNPEKHIVLTRTMSYSEEWFFDGVRASVAKSAKKEAFVFVHGYNVSFEDAARRTGQIAFDLGFIGAPIFYSWPSNDKITNYIKDETNITWSTPHLQRFLTLLSQNSGAVRIHIIAHSMGNRAVCDALKALSYDQGNSVKFNHLVLAAPDIDAETFQELATTLQRLAARVTVYESSKDKALFASKKIHGNARAGEPLLIIPGLDTIDASLIDTDFLGHSYFSETWPLLSDIHSLLFNDELASQRFGLMKIDSKAGTYYAFRA